MLDKYKKLAQDAQHNGDRVQMEYYLQFADHYLRVISDNKARMDEARTKRGDTRSDARGDNSDSRDDDDDDGDNRRNDNRDDSRSDSRSDKRNDGRKNPRRSRSKQDDSDGFNSDGPNFDGPNFDRDDSDRFDSDGDDRDYNSADNDTDDNDFDRPSAPKSRRRRVVAKEESRPKNPQTIPPTRARKPRAKKPLGDAGDKSGGEIDSAVLPPAIGG